ncbi:hypothetical protein AVEN_158909-1 [Araneus ventricosus]|uniref:Tesmin/TSO1-like CXC domain-containing protein n=1 Tax=Araneus ventricosus TaxID=182803 RepID=A0A4Y2BBF1_ARAVE|nr:hypothetical protein AVEN_158909-1 [Araneus ventricosus]
MMGENFENVKFKRKGKVVTVASINSSVKIGNISIVVDPLMLFHRLCIAEQSDDDLKAFFKFQLSPFPISLFTGEGMRKGTKSSLYTSFSPITEDVKPEGSQYVMVDGGHLLHKIVWRQQATFGAIADRYVQYLNNKYGQDMAVIFDGYPDDDKKSTKNCERFRRAAHSSPDVMFHEETVLQCTQVKLLANECNKKRFIELLKKALQKANICVQQAVEDADSATFLNPQATTEQVTEAGENVLVALYGGDPATQSLDELRYHSFVKAAAKTKFNLARLPPTTDAAQLHAMRSYHQEQTWLGNEKDPLKWGWMHTPSGLFPKKAEKDPAPESLLKCISCTCIKGCTNACGCRKAGLHCSLLCKHCNGQSCENTMPGV